MPASSKCLFQININICHKLSDVANPTFQTLTAPAQPIRRAASAMSAVEEDPVDAREIDKVLTEVAGMAGRWSLFRKFLHERLKVNWLGTHGYTEAYLLRDARKSTVKKMATRKRKQMYLHRQDLLSREALIATKYQKRSGL